MLTDVGRNGVVSGRTDSPLSEEQVQSYNDNGYLVVENLLPLEECDRLMTIFEEYADEDYSAILNLDRSEPEIRQLMKQPDIVSRVEQLQGTEVVGLMSQMLFKKAGSRYAVQAWNPHQDNSYPQAEYGAYITTNIFFEDADADNGGMYIYPGSHKEGLLPYATIKSYREGIGENPGNVVEPPEKYQKIDLVTKKGGMLVLNGCVVHGSYPNESPERSRPLCQLIYIKRGINFISGKNANRTAIPLH